MAPGRGRRLYGRHGPWGAGRCWLALLIGVISALWLGTAATLAAPPRQGPTPVPLQQALDKGQVEVWAQPIGHGWRQPLVRLHVKSQSGSPLTVAVPVGLHLECPDDERFADLVVAAPAECQPPQTSVEVVAYSLARQRAFPSTMTGGQPNPRYTVGSPIGKDLLLLLETLQAQATPPRHDSPFCGAQLAVWSRVEKLKVADLVASIGAGPGPDDVSEAEAFAAEAQKRIDEGEARLRAEIEAKQREERLQQWPRLLGYLGLGLAAFAALAAALALIAALPDLFHRKGKGELEIPHPQPLSQVRERGDGPHPQPLSHPGERGREEGQARPAARLVGVGGPLAGRTLELAECCLVSRGPLAWLVIQDSSISLPHAAFDLSGLPCRVKDLNSRNGVRVGEARLERGFAELAEEQEAILGTLGLIALPGSLLVSRGALKGRSYPVPQALLIVSREEVPVLVTGLQDPRISDAHALFRADGEGLRVKDLNSSNGVLVNGQRIREETRLNSGDRIQLGYSEFEVREGG